MLEKLKKSFLFKKNKVLSSIVFALALCNVFIAGSFYSETKIEYVAQYASNIVKQSKKDYHYCCLTIGKTETSGALLDSDSEFHNLYGTFKQQNITFASSINPNKNRDIFIKDISDNLSMLYIGPVGTIEYKGHYKHYVSPIEVMFPDERNYDISRYVAYISQTHADKLLELKGIQRNSENFFSENDYLSLIKTIIPFEIDGESYDFVIQNIYYQTNYYYEGLNDVMGDFVMVSYYLPLDLRNEQRNMYFLNRYTYENKFFLKHINDGYSSKKYDIKVNTFNLEKPFNEEKLLDFYYSKDLYSFDWLSLLLFIISGVLLVFSIGLLFSRFAEETKKCFYIIPLFALLIPYCAFGFSFLLSGNIIFFSDVSTKTNAIFILLSFLAVVLLNTLLKKKHFKEDIKEWGYYEIDV